MAAPYPGPTLKAVQRVDAKEDLVCTQVWRPAQSANSLASRRSSSGRSRISRNSSLLKDCELSEGGAWNAYLVFRYVGSPTLMSSARTTT